ncbi:hypothetical protein OS493_020089 [Desmophyllum pertusum]|uniref:Uncharacterized protein n=1 Tax=Desmophyllum pertusum TaxID=174260 RepID=A0A9W9YF00_9CNID|nr:hypothetical protein OS493_020089 [Desmophyllum pertusum]
MMVPATDLAMIASFACFAAENELNRPLRRRQVLRFMPVLRHKMKKKFVYKSFPESKSLELRGTIIAIV